MKKKKLILLILLALAVVLTVLYFAVVRPIVNRSQNKTLEPVALLPGEGYYKIQSETNQIPVMFPPVDRSELYEIRILNKEQTYGFTHYLSNGKDYFTMWTEGAEDANGDGKPDRTVYLPELARMNGNFDYTTLYDETSKIPMMIIAAGSVNFKNRVYIRERDAADPNDDEEYDRVLRRYGLSDDDHPVSYEITPLMRDDRGNLMYYDADGNLYCTDGDKTAPKYWNAIALKTSGYDYENTPTVDVTGKNLSVLGVGDDQVIRVYVGEMLPDESGYYLRLDGRDVVYSTGTTTVGKIVYQTLAYYIQPRLAQAVEDQNAELYTPSFRIFTGTGEKSDAITPSDTVVFTSSYARKNAVLTDKSGALALGSSGALPADLVAGLVGKSVGDSIPLLYGTTAEPFWEITSSRKTEYEIYSVAAIIRDGEYLTDNAVVSEEDTVICTYAADGRSAIGMIDLTTAPEALANVIVGLAVGTDFDEPRPSATVDFSDAPTFEEAIFQVQSIMAYATNAAFNAGLTEWDKSRKLETQTAKLPSSGSLGYVEITCSVKRNGVLAVYENVIVCLDGGNGSLALDQMATAIRLSDAESGNLVLGYRDDGVKTTVKMPADPFSSFVVYRDFKIEGVYGTDEVVGVAYVNDTERNIFYGGSAYEITSPADRTVYSVNNDNLMNVLQEVFEEAKGSITVAVGLTKENFDKYGLGAHVVYFEMPLGVTYRDGTTMDVGIRDRVGFHLYVSERQEGDFYYVASDLYGIVVRASISDSDFSFVDWEFASMWVDDQMLLLNLTNVRDITFRINYDDLKETHGFAVSVNPSYHTSEEDDDVTSRIYVAYVRGEAPTYTYAMKRNSEVELDNRNLPTSLPYTTYGRQLRVIDENFCEVRFVNNVDENGNRIWIGLDDHYKNCRDGADLAQSGVYYEGVSNFTKLITLIFTSYYSGAVSPSDLSVAEAARVGDLLEKDPETGKFVLSDDDPKAMERAVFTVSMSLVDGRRFRLAFYPYSDSRYLLSFEDESAGVVSRQFYMNMGEIKNVVTAVKTIVAGGSVRYDVSYLPDPKTN